MVECNKVKVKLSDSQLNKLKSAVKNQTRTTLRMNFRMFDGNNLPHKLLLLLLLVLLLLLLLLLLLSH